jgi:hypothetical protein
MKIKHIVFFVWFCFPLNTYAFSKPISVDVAYNGADALTRSLEQTLRKQISSSRDFALSSDQRRALILSIAENVKLKKIANHNQVSYKVSFISQQKTISVSVGSCWEGQLAECADQILHDAKITIRQKP